jgi:hypothetical protein
MTHHIIQSIPDEFRKNHIVIEVGALKKSFIEAPIAQLAEHFISNEEVFGSIPNGSSFFTKKFYLRFLV